MHTLYTLYVIYCVHTIRNNAHSTHCICCIIHMPALYALPSSCNPCSHFFTERSKRNLELKVSKRVRMMSCVCACVCACVCCMCICVYMYIWHCGDNNSICCVLCLYVKFISLPVCSKTCYGFAVLVNGAVHKSIVCSQINCLFTEHTLLVVCPDETCSFHYH